MTNFGEHITAPQSLANYLNTLHATRLPYASNGEIIFRECRSEQAVQQNSGWARAEFRRGGLERLTYVRPPEWREGKPFIHSITYHPLVTPEQQFVQTTQYVEPGDVFCQESEYIQDPSAVVEEISMYLLQSMEGRNYDVSPEHRPISFADAVEDTAGERWRRVITKARRAGWLGLQMFGTMTAPSLFYGKKPQPRKQP